MSVPSIGHLELQRGGCCSIMPFFNGHMVELPVTTTQDYSLFHILKQHSIDVWKQQLSLISERNGRAASITHPDYLQETRAQKTYTALLNHLKEVRSQGKSWMALPRDVCRWWRDRSCMRLARRRKRSVGSRGARERFSKGGICQSWRPRHRLSTALRGLGDYARGAATGVRIGGVLRVFSPYG